VGTLILAITTVALLPFLIAHTPLRNLLTRGIQQKTGAQISVGQASLSWFRGVELRNIRIQNSLDQPVGSVSSVKLEKSPWQLLLRPSEVGTVTIDQPELTIHVRDHGTNLVFAPNNDFSDSSEPTSSRRRGSKTVELRLLHGRLLLAAKNERDKHVLIPDLNVTARFDESRTSRTVDLEPCTLLRRVDATRELCQFGLKYVAPILANTSWAKGSLSAELEECHLDLAGGLDSHFRGRLVIHSLEAGPNSPLMRAISALVAKLLKTASIESIKLASESEIQFRLADGRVHHEGLAFGLPDVSSELLIRTHGSVGLSDQTLDMQVDIPLPIHLLGAGQLAQSLGSQTIHIPIGGTLDKPDIRFQGDGRIISELLAQLAQAGANDQLELSKVLERLRELRMEREASQEASTPRRGRAGGLLERLRQFRKKGSEEAAETDVRDELPSQDAARDMDQRARNQSM
jgi:hypothetical protein